MSTGGYIGAVVGLVIGAVIGFVIGGPGGALMGGLYGMSLGFAAGMYIDPMTPDTPSSVAPLPAGVEVMTTVVGDPLPDLLGTAKITGHLLCFGKERTETIYAESGGGGKGGGGDSPDPQVSGYEYYMSWAVGIVAGPVDTLYAVYKNNDIVWEGELNLPTDSDSFGQETIVLDDMGTAIFYFGTDDQVANTKVGEIIGDDTLNSPYRHFCWCFLDDCHIGKYNRAPTMKFILRKSPAVAFSEDGVIQTYDYNPMHAIWYILHDLVDLPETWLHSDDFIAAALTLSDETRGISCLFMSQQSAVSYLENINGHIDGIIRYGSDGKFHPKLIRDDYVVDNLPLIDENVMLDDPTLKRKSWIDTANEVKVQYTEIMAYGPFPQGEWVAAKALLDSTKLYLFDIEYRAVIKVDTSIIPPICPDALQITESELDYGMGHGACGEGQRGGYCMNKDGTRLWYLFRKDQDCELVEVDISGSSMKKVKSTSFPSLMVGAETIQDGCSDNSYTYWCTSRVSGRIIKIRNSDHTIVDDHLFSFDLHGCATNQEGIVTIDYSEETGRLYWVYVLRQAECSGSLYYAACAHYIISDIDFTIKVDREECGSGGITPWWQNLIRVMDSSYVLQHKSYHPSSGPLVKRHLTDFSPTILYSTINQEYLTNILGVDDGELFTLMHYNVGFPFLWLKCLDYNLMSQKVELDVSGYCDHSVSVMNSKDDGSKIISLFRYDGEQNIVTCFSADDSLTKLCESFISNKIRIDYGD
jgi:hypothetical protein